MTTTITKTGIDQLLDKLQSEFGAKKITPLITASERWQQKHLRELVGVGEGDDIGIA